MSSLLKTLAAMAHAGKQISIYGSKSGLGRARRTEATKELLNDLTGILSRDVHQWDGMDRP